MPVDEINSVNQVLPTAVQSLVRTAAQQTPTPPSSGVNSAPAAVAAPQELTSAQQAALLVNDTLAGLNFVPASSPGSLLIDETDVVGEEVLDTQDLTPAEQAALLINETLEDLNFVPFSADNALLINETNPELATFLETQNLTPAQQAALAVNLTLQAQAAPLVAPEATILATAANAPAPATAIPPTTPLTAAAGVATGIVETAGTNLAAQAAVAAQGTAAATATTVASEEPAQPATVQPDLVTNPIAVPVYEIRDQKPVPPEPKPTRRDVLPSLPIGRVRPVDPLVLRQEWERRKESGQRQEMPPPQPLAERSIQQMVSQANEDLLANGLPLRLVLAKTGAGGYSLDIYDCSDDKVCRLSQEVPLDLSELLIILDNLQHETGIIINIKT